MMPRREDRRDGPAFLIIAKPMDNIEGNALPKERAVNYTCFDSSVSRKAVVIDMVKFKIAKYFSAENKAIEAEGKPAEEDPDGADFGLSEEEDLYHLTFKRRYYNDFVICQECFKEGSLR